MLQAGNRSYADAAAQYARLKAQSGTAAGLRAFQAFQQTNTTWQHYYLDTEQQKQMMRFNNPQLDAVGVRLQKWSPLSEASARLAGVIP